MKAITVYEVHDTSARDGAVGGSIEEAVLKWMTDNNWRGLQWVTKHTPHTVCTAWTLFPDDVDDDAFECTLSVIQHVIHIQ